MKLLVLISAFAVVYSRPQPSNSHESQAVQIEKQEVREIKPLQSKTLLQNDEQIKRAQSTKEIIEKIVEINKKHGLSPKGLKTNQDYVQVPILQRSAAVAKQQNFQFPQTPFSNPIFDYLIANSNSDKIRSQNVNNPSTYSVINTNAEVNPGDHIPGQFIKRKVTHHQTVVLPVVGGMGNYNPMGFEQMPMAFGYPNPVPPQNFLQPPYQQNFPVPTRTNTSENSSHSDTIKKTLENQTVENVKNIVNTQLPPQVIFSGEPSVLPFIPVGSRYYELQNAAPSQLSGNSYRVNGLSARIPDEILFEQLGRPGRQWQWPLAQYFPIVIKDPLQQIFNAFTSMIEYGQPGGDALCADQSKDNKVAHPGKNLHEEGLIKDINANDSPVEDDSKRFLGSEINDDKLQISVEDQDAPISLALKINYSSDTQRAAKGFQEEEVPRINTKVTQISENVKKVVQVANNEKEINEDAELEPLGKDNSDSGITIQKLKVRKGGVAIAGPGGIATAGSGGTAIVGPNGYIYTQPNSLAIAGSGTKVIAVDPQINLSEIFDNAQRNKAAVNPDLGKVIAIGPVVYYNKG